MGRAGFTHTKKEEDREGRSINTHVPLRILPCYTGSQKVSTPLKGWAPN